MRHFGPYSQDSGGRKNSEETNSFEIKKETKYHIDHSKVEKKGGKAQKTEIICEICNKRQSSKFNLRQHIGSVHVGKRPF